MSVNYAIPLRRAPSHLPSLFPVVPWLLIAAFHFCSAATLRSESISIDGPVGKINGILELPSIARPSFVLLFIVGSGPTDLDGNNPLGVAGSPYRSLAKALVEQGAAVARFDKRGVASSSGAMSDPNNVTIDDYASDVTSWVALLKKKTHTPCAWVLGHSEGGLIALKAAQHDSSICGLILIAAPGRPFGEIIRAQLAQRPANAPLMPQANSAIDSLEAGRPVDDTTLPAPLQPLFAHQIQHFLINVMALDPVQLAASLHKPILVIQGTNDLQIEMKDAENLAKASSTASLVRIDHMNHVMKDVPDIDEQQNMASYANPSLPLDPGVAQVITSFVTAH